MFFFSIHDFAIGVRINTLPLSFSFFFNFFFKFSSVGFEDIFMVRDAQVCFVLQWECNQFVHRMSYL